MITSAVAAAELLARRRARASLLPFAAYTHPRWQTGDHHRVICEHLEAVERGEIKRLLIESPPRHTKSELASKRLPAWWMGRHPDAQIICASHTDSLAQDFGADVRGIVGSDEYQRLFPGTRLQPDAKAAGRWRTTAGGIYIATGVGGAIPGRGAHLLIIDDPVKGRNDAESPRMRELAWRWYTGDAVQRLMPGGAIVLMQTRWHEDDLAGRVRGTEDWTILTLPAIADEHTDHERALWPEWWPLDVLRAKREMLLKANRRADWAAQYQQDPAPEEGTYMLREWFGDAMYDKPPTHINVYGASDLAVTESKESTDPDYTEHGVFGVDENGDIWVIDWWSGQDTADVWINAQHDLARKWRPLAWFSEAGVIRRATEPLRTRMRREQRVRLRDVWIAPIADKMTRGRAFQAMASMGRVHFPRTPWAERIIEQCVGFPGLRYDDAFDVMSIFCGAVDQAHPAIVPVEHVEHHAVYERAAYSYSSQTSLVI